jgi:Zn-dependent protease
MQLLFGRWRIGTFFGIGLYVHWSMILILLWIAWQVSADDGSGWDIAFQIALFLCVLTCVTLHEYGHALAAKMLGVNTRDITLLPIGGVAMLERIPKRPRDEFLIAIAGPAVNVVLVFLIALVLAAAGQAVFPMFSLTEFTSVPVEESITPSVGTLDWWMGIAHFLLFVNVILAVFNMLPAFPMDGGRVLRSILAVFLPYVSATRWAGRVGMVIMLLLLIYAISSDSSPQAFLALFILWAGAREVQQVVAQDAMRGLRIRDVMLHKFQVLSTATTVDEALKQTEDDLQKDWPIVNQEGVYFAMLSAKTLAAAAMDGKFDSTLQGLALVPMPALYPEESLEDAVLGSDVCKTLPVLGPGNEVIGILDLGSLSRRVAIVSVRSLRANRTAKN